MSTVNTTLHILAFDDNSASNNPSLRPVDWKRSFVGIPFENPVSQSKSIQPLSTVTLFDASISTTIDGTTEFSLSLSSLDSNRYIIKNTAGQVPTFRTARNTPISGGTISVTTSVNGLVMFTHSATPFGAVAVGDTVFIPGITTGDPAGVFNTLNEGTFTVVSATSASLVCVRPNGDFSGITEAGIAIAYNSVFQVFSSAGVQIGDSVLITNGFQLGARKTFSVLAVTDSRIEIQSTTPLADEVGTIPGATGMKFFSSAKRLIYIEVDQDAVVRLNGDTGDSNQISPLAPGDDSLRGVLLKHGNVWKLTLENKSTANMKTVVITAE